jgi:protein-S-isoprenylcysteine O-methyltransferase Ste14
VTRTRGLALLLSVSAVGSVAYALTRSMVAATEVLVLHGFFLVDLKFRPCVSGEGREPRLWEIVSKIFLVCLLYGPVGFLSIWPRRWPVEVSGLGLTVLGSVLGVWGRRSLGRMATERLMILNDHTLFTSGPYRIIRHPIYGGIALALLGHQLAFVFLPGVVLWLLFVVLVLRPRISIEEGMLLERFSDVYAQYQRQTWRLFPGIY